MISMQQNSKHADFSKNTFVPHKKNPGTKKEQVSQTVVTAASFPSGFFQFSRKLDYGLFLLTVLAKNHNHAPLSLRHIAEKNQMSFFFLQKIALELRRAGFIEASRGQKGGYILQKSPHLITLKKILETLEGSLSLMHCLVPVTKTKTCLRHDSCSMRNGLQRLNILLLHVIEQFTLADLLQSQF